MLDRNETSLRNQILPQEIVHSKEVRDTELFNQLTEVNEQLIIV